MGLSLVAYEKKGNCLKTVPEKEFQMKSMCMGSDIRLSQDLRKMLHDAGINFSNIVVKSFTKEESIEILKNIKRVKYLSDNDIRNQNTLEIFFETCINNDYEVSIL